MELGIDSFASVIAGRGAAVSSARRVANLLEEAEAADRAGLDVFGLGEHHRQEFIESAPTVLFGAIAARTRNIRLQSSVTVLGAADPVRVFQDYATIDLISDGRAEIVAGRGSSTEAYPLFGFDLADRDALFDEKIRLLMRLREESHPHWQGRFRPPLQGYGIYPRPVQSSLPLWLGVGGTPASFARAGHLGIPLMVAIIGGSFGRFRSLVDLYRSEAVITGSRLSTRKLAFMRLVSWLTQIKRPATFFTRDEVNYGASSGRNAAGHHPQDKSLMRCVMATGHTSLAVHKLSRANCAGCRQLLEA